MIKRLKNIWLWTVLGTYFVLAIGWTAKKEKQLKCSKIKVVLNENSAYGFISESNIIHILKKNHIAITGIALQKIDRAKIEKILENNRYIKNAEVYFNPDHHMIIEISQRTPVFRIITKHKSYYVDTDRRILPLSEKGRAHVHIVLGEVTMKMAQNEIFDLISNIRKSEFWNAQIDHLMINEKGEVDIFVKVGIHRIRFGKIENINEKLKNLLAFYQQTIKSLNCENYKMIDLRFKNQIVCKRIE